MPKDWITHKNELKRLYITEDRPLEEVRSILKARYGFDASTRSYRMKLDEWNMRKYNLSKLITPRKKSSRNPAKPARPHGVSVKKSLSPVPEIEQVDCFCHDILIPRRDLEISDLLPLIETESALDSALEILLRKWRPDKGYLQAAKSFLQNEKYCYTIMERTSRGESLFELIERKVLSPERFELTKAVLEADLSHRHPEEERSSPWAIVWRSACSQPSFHIARDLLLSERCLPPRARKLFSDHAIVVVGERCLRRLMDQLEDLRTKSEPLTNLEQCFAAQWRNEYMKILKYFLPQRLEVNPSWYKYSLQIMEWNEALASKTVSKWNDGNKLGHFHSVEQHTVLDNFETMISNWRSGHGLTIYIQAVLRRPECNILILETLVPSKKNLFDLICEKVRKSEQVSLAQDFLHILSESNPHSPTSQYICWRAAFIESDWTRFKRAISLVSLQLNGCMSREAARLVFRATFLHVGKRLIDAYRVRFDMADSLGSGSTVRTAKHIQQYFESPAYYRDREQYGILLRDFRLRCVNHWESTT